MVSRSLIFLFLSWFASICAINAQITASLKLSKKQYLTGEDVVATVTITNNSGKAQTFGGDDRKSWLLLNVLNSNGDPVSPRGKTLFQPMKIGSGQTLAREIVLSQYYQLYRPGTYSISATINPTGNENLSAITNRAFFSQTTASTYWSQKIGLASDPNETREFKVLSFVSDNKSFLYAQINDPNSGIALRTFPIGEVLMTRRPTCTIDGKQCLHVLFLATPSIWIHCVVTSSGQLIAREFYQFGPQGSPQLYSFPDGSVRIQNAIPYKLKDETAPKSNSHKASDRPSATF